MPPDDLTGFGDLEATTAPEEFIETLDDLSGGLFEDATRRGADALHVEPGDQVLDAGCGTGEFAVSLVGQVGSEGLVVGIDRSDTMVAEARRRAAGADNVTFEVGDVTRLRFDPDTFDALHMERVLLYVADAARAIGELVRVAKPGARLALVEPDIGTWTIDSDDDDQTRRVLEFFEAIHPRAWAGRQLRRLLVDAGVADVRIDATTAILTDVDRWARTFRIAELLERGSSEASIPREALARWWDELRAAGADGRFFWSVTVFVASGRVR